jgi:Flp pilus assembly protein TadG
MRFLRRSFKGQTLVLFAFAIFGVLGAIALATDVAVMYVNWQNMQKAVDEAALAGANALPEDPTLATSQATSYAEQNGIAQSELQGPTIPADNSAITVAASRDVPYYFGRVVGLKSQLIQVSATAAPNYPPCQVGGLNTQSTCSSPTSPGSSPPGNYGTTVGEYGLIPVALQSTTPYQYNESIQLTQGGTGNNGTWGPGNWGMITLGAPGGAVVRSNFANGYSGPVSVGQWVNTATGQKNGPVDQGITDRINAALNSAQWSTGTFSNHAPNDPRAVVLPLVDWNNPGVNGTSGVQVQAFAMVWVDSVNGGVINAHFIRGVVPDSIPNPQALDYGARGVPILIK